MQILSESTEYNIFQTDAMQNYIDFKWSKVGRNHHAFGAMQHFLYLIYLSYYINDIYIDASFQKKKDRDPEAQNLQSIFFILFVLYPFGYENLQMMQIGFADYITDLQNIQTIVFVSTGILNGVIHYFVSPYALFSKYVMILNIMFSLARSLEQLRILETFSPIVTMMSGVFAEFYDFMIFFFILLSFLSVGLGVLQIDDPRISQQYREDIKAAGGYGYAGSEY